MRISCVTIAAISMLGSAVCFGQAAQSDTTKGNTVPNQQAQATPGGNDTPTAAMAATCKKQAADQKLKGDAKKKYISDCKAGKTTREGQ